MKGNSVVLAWVAVYCTLKQQTVLLVALRGCDGIVKEDPSKSLVRSLRGVILRNADGNTQFMGELSDVAVKKFLESLDHYPVHWLTHFLHAVEIVGYKHPILSVRFQWQQFYKDMVNALHLSPETELELDIRLADKE